MLSAKEIRKLYQLSREREIIIEFALIPPHSYDGKQQMLRINTF